MKDTYRDPLASSILTSSLLTFSPARSSYDHVSSGTSSIDALVRRNGSEFSFMQILKEVVDSPMVPGVVSVRTLIFVVC